MAKRKRHAITSECNPAGRPKGSRNKLGEDVLAAGPHQVQERPVRHPMRRSGRDCRGSVNKHGALLTVCPPVLGKRWGDSSEAKRQRIMPSPGFGRKCAEGDTLKPD